MLFPALRKIQQHFNWESTNLSVSGLYENYLFRIQDHQGYKSITIYLPKLEKNEALELQSIFSSKKDAILYSDFKINEKLIYFIFEEKWRPFGYLKLKNGIERIAQILRGENIDHSTYCYECGTTEDLIIYEARDIYKSTFLLCSKDALRIESEMKNHRSNYFKISLKRLAIGFLTVLPFHTVIVVLASISPLFVAFTSPFLPVFIFGVTLWLFDLLKFETKLDVDLMSYGLLLITIISVDYFIIKKIDDFWIAILFQILGLTMIFPFLNLTIKSILKPKLNELQRL